MKTVVFASYTPLNETLLRLLPLDFLSSRGIPVSYWDLSPLYGHSLPGREVARPYARAFRSWRELGAALKEPGVAETLIVTALPYEPKTYRAHRLLSRSPARLGAVVSGVMPVPTGSPLRRLGENLPLLLDPGKIAHFGLKRAALAARRAGLVRAPGVVFAAGEAAREEAGPARVVPINHYDYDDWLEARDSDRPPAAGRYAVFLDQYLPHHPDFKLLGLKTLVEPSRYYALLNAHFERLERRHGVEMIVAAHPKADYRDNPFGGRKILRGAARPLVRFCEFALTSYSTALSYAVLDAKPLLFFTTDDIARRYRRIRLDLLPACVAKTLGRTCAVLDRPREEDELAPSADPRLYDAYKRRYLVSPETEGRLSRDAYLDFFSRELATRGAAG